MPLSSFRRYGCATVATEVERGRESYAQASWAAAYDALAEAEAAEPLEAADLELLATAAYMLGREDEWMRLFGEACGRYAERGDGQRAARCAFWIGMQLAIRGQTGPATGWFGRAHRLLEGEPECVEHAYLRMPVRSSAKPKATSTAPSRRPRPRPTLRSDSAIPTSSR